MPLLTDLSRTLGVESLDPETARKLAPLLEHLAKNFDSIRNALSGLTIGDNLASEVVVARFSHNVPQTVKLQKLTKAGAAVVLGADGAVTWGAPKIKMVGEKQARVTVFFNSPAVLNKSVALLMLPDGVGSSTDATFVDPILKSLLTAVGDLIYASAASTPARLAAPADGAYSLTFASGVPSYTAAAAGVTTRTTPDANDVIVWKLNENAAPFANSGSGGALNLSQIAGAAFIREGWVGQLTAPMFTASGTRNGLKTGDTSIGESNSITISCWVKRNFISDAFPMMFCKNYKTGTTAIAPFYGVGLRFDNSTQSFQVLISIGGVLTTFDNTKVGDNIVNGSWTHAGLTYDATSGVATLYVNGAAVVAATPGPGNIDWGSHGPWFVGEGIDTASQSLEGQVQDVRIANVVRPASYFQTIYRAGMTR